MYWRCRALQIFHYGFPAIVIFIRLFTCYSITSVYFYVPPRRGSDPFFPPQSSPPYFLIFALATLSSVCFARISASNLFTVSIHTTWSISTSDSASTNFLFPLSPAARVERGRGRSTDDDDDATLAPGGGAPTNNPDSV